MSQTRNSFLAPALLCALALSAAFVTRTRAQTAPSADTKLALKAALVLTPEFCGSKASQGVFWTTGKETYFIGKVACAEFEPTLKDAFSSLVRIADASSGGDAQVLFLPRLVNVSKTASQFGKATTDMVVSFEWTVKDLSGKTVWIETVQGHAQDSRHRKGISLEDYGTVLNRIVKEAVKDAAEQSARKMAASPELRKLTQ